MSLILYGLPLSPFYRKVEMTLREKGVPFEAEAVNIMPMPDWFKEISPAQRIPVANRNFKDPFYTLGRGRYRQVRDGRGASS